MDLVTTLYECRHQMISVKMKALAGLSGSVAARAMSSVGKGGHCCGSVVGSGTS